MDNLSQNVFFVYKKKTLISFRLFRCPSFQESPFLLYQEAIAAIESKELLIVLKCLSRKSSLVLLGLGTKAIIGVLILDFQMRFRTGLAKSLEIGLALLEKTCLVTKFL